MGNNIACHMAVSLLSLVAMMGQGCCSPSHRAADATPVATIFTTGKPVQIVVNTQPYEVTDAALSSLQSFFSDSLGLETQVSRVRLQGVTKSDSSAEDIFNAAKPVLENAKAPTIMVFTVRSVKGGHGIGFCIQGQTSHGTGEHYPVAVVVLNRGWFLEKNFESLLLKHEVGHWVGLPVRDFHKLKNNTAHCTNLHCLMMPGPGSDPLRWCCGGALSILFFKPAGFLQRLQGRTGPDEGTARTNRRPLSGCTDYIYQLISGRLWAKPRWPPVSNGHVTDSTLSLQIGVVITLLFS